MDAQRREAREGQALQSPKWDTKLVAEHCLRWLLSEQERERARGRREEEEEEGEDGGGAATDDVIWIAADGSARDAAGTLLHRMVLDGGVASSVCAMLDRWKAWADNGGMRRSDMDALRAAPAVFARAALLAAVIRDAAAAAMTETAAAAHHHDGGGALAVDLQECLRMWRTVRLG